MLVFVGVIVGVIVLVGVTDGVGEGIGADEVVVEAIGLLARQGQNLLGAGSEVVEGFFAHGL